MGKRLALALFAAIVSAAGAAWTTAAVIRSVAPTWGSDLNNLAPVLIAVVYAAVIITLLLVLGRTPGQRAELLAIGPSGLRAIGFGAAVWAGAYLVAFVAYLALGIVGGPSVADAGELLLSVGADNGRLADASALLVAVILVRILVLSPLAEELIFRGALYTWLRTRFSAAATVVMTGVAFGLIHQSPTFIPLAILVGIAAGWIRERTDSVLVPVIIHSFQSAAVVLASLVLTGWDAPALLG